MYELWLSGSSIIGMVIMIGGMFGMVYVMATWHEGKDEDGE